MLKIKELVKKISACGNTGFKLSGHQINISFKTSFIISIDVLGISMNWEHELLICRAGLYNHDAVNTPTLG